MNKRGRPPTPVLVAFPQSSCAYGLTDAAPWVRLSKGFVCTCACALRPPGRCVSPATPAPRSQPASSRSSTPCPGPEILSAAAAKAWDSSSGWLCSRLLCRRRCPPASDCNGRGPLAQCSLGRCRLPLPRRCIWCRRTRPPPCSARARVFTPAFARLVVCELFQQAPVGHIRVQPDVLREGDRHVDAPIEPHGFSGDAEDSLEPDIYFVDIDASVRLLSARVGR